MTIVTMALAKRITDDGCFEMHDHIPLGKAYLVDMDSKAQVNGYNFEKEVFWTHIMVTDVETGELLPLELLDVPKEA